MVLAMKAGLEPEQVVSALGSGVAGSWILANRSGKMIANEYALGFRTSLHLKDLGIALAMARELGVALPVTALTAQFENSLVARGFGDEDMSNLARVLRELAGLG
jgi:3-hydroxyisobutyrate dehydrogenase